jgi:hypothetical protein
MMPSGGCLDKSAPAISTNLSLKIPIACLRSLQYQPHSRQLKKKPGRETSKLAEKTTNCRGHDCVRVDCASFSVPKSPLSNGHGERLFGSSAPCRCAGLLPARCRSPCIQRGSLLSPKSRSFGWFFCCRDPCECGTGGVWELTTSTEKKRPPLCADSCAAE